MSFLSSAVIILKITGFAIGASNPVQFNPPETVPAFLGFLRLAF
jgi:hypothetical protein